MRDRYSGIMGRVLIALALGFLAGLVIPAACHAQSIPRRVLLPVSAVALGAIGGTIDHDAGGYRDSFRLAPDKQAHFLASVVLAKAVADGTSVKLGLATCLLAGAAWEAGQRRHHGYASRYDLAYDAGGCLVGALWGRRP